VHLTDLRVVFDANVKSRMQAINESRAHRSPIDLAVQQTNSRGEPFWVIGRPPDGLAFARSDGSGGHERRVLSFRTVGFGDLRGFGGPWQNQLV